MERQLLQDHKQAEKRGKYALSREHEKRREQKEKLQKIVERRNKALREAYDRASHLVQRYRSLHEGNEEQMQFPPPSIPEEGDFHEQFGVAVIRTFMPQDTSATEAAQLHHQLTQHRIDRKKEADHTQRERAHYRYEEAHLHLTAEKVGRLIMIDFQIRGIV
jgi:hypothetical protein